MSEQINIVQGNPTPFLIGCSRTNSCGSASADDFACQDYPPRRPSWGNRAKIATYALATETQLIGAMAAELMGCAGQLGLMACAQFISGLGSPVYHRQGSALAEMARGSQTFRNSVESVRQRVEANIRTQAAGGAIDYRRIPVDRAMRNIPFSLTSHDLTIPVPLRAIIGGTQGLEVYLLNFSAVGRAFTATLQFRIGDNFGVSEDDMYSPGLIAFWILQHTPDGSGRRRPCRPYINYLIIDEGIAGTF